MPNFFNMYTVLSLILGFCIGGFFGLNWAFDMLIKSTREALDAAIESKKAETDLLVNILKLLLSIKDGSTTFKNVNELLHSVIVILTSKIVEQIKVELSEFEFNPARTINDLLEHAQSIGHRAFELHRFDFEKAQEYFDNTLIKIDDNIDNPLLSAFNLYATSIYNRRVSEESKSVSENEKYAE